MKTFLVVISLVSLLMQIVSIVIIGYKKPSQATRILLGLLNLAFLFTAWVTLYSVTTINLDKPASEYRYQYMPIPKDSMFIKVPVQP